MICDLDCGEWTRVLQDTRRLSTLVVLISRSYAQFLSTTVYPPFISSPIIIL